MRVETAAKQFSEYQQEALPAVHENEWVEDCEESIARRIAFFKWAEQEGLTTDPNFEFVEGGREHLIFESPSRGEFLKATIPPILGYYVDVDEYPPRLFPNQNPVEYLQRFIAMEEIWGFQSELIAVVGDSSKYTIIIRQNLIVGEAASLTEIREHMTSLKFAELNISLGYTKSLSFFNENFAIFDLRPANVVKMNEGVVIPIDCFVSRLKPEQVESLKNLQTHLHGVAGSNPVAPT